MPTVQPSLDRNGEIYNGLGTPPPSSSPPPPPPSTTVHAFFHSRPVIRIYFYCTPMTAPSSICRGADTKNDSDTRWTQTYAYRNSDENRRRTVNKRQLQQLLLRRWPRT
jgi:hypothetical protein